MLALLVAAVVSSALWRVPAEASATRATAYADSAFRATNVHRADQGRVQLREAACLTRMAERWARHMARTGRMVHQDLEPIIRRCELSMVGENIAVGYSSGRAVVKRGWMHSEGHRANILRREYRLMGIGAARDSNGRWWASQVFGRS
ncbi:hypothetical protein GCM10023350_13260 [Nocardioides endophyticus]|uniref:SCP domain-containing protein n=2 Tax=Nocardioides endophyticus TaxID=1353775 RepID=A0ABP8YIK9_9ACTN